MNEEIDITELVYEDVFPFSHSRAEGGQDAGRNTWRAALGGPALLKTPEQIQAARDYFRSTGGWTREECDAFTEQECQALTLQFVSGAIREAGADSLEEIDWKDYEEQSEAGQVSGQLFKGDDNRYYFYMGE